MHTQTAPEGSGVVGILMLGVDMATERALLQRLRALAGTPPERIAPTDDLARCAVLVAHEDSPMARAARHMVADRPGLRFWTLGADGTLRDGRDGRAPLDGAAIRAALGASPSSPASASAADAPLARRLRELALAGEGVAALIRDGRLLLWLDFGRRLAVPPVAGAHDALAGAVASAFHRLRLEPLPARGDDARAQAAHGLPLAPFLWNVALRIEGPTPLLDPLSRRSVLSLRRWPDFRALAHRHDHFRLCCLLLKRPSTTHEAAALLDLDGRCVDGFFNAAYLSGYAGITGESRAPAPAAHPAPAQPRMSALARMWRTMRHGLQVGP